MVVVDKNQLSSNGSYILQNLDVGDPAGETDRLLEDCRIETSPFIDLMENRKDLVLGPKGSGKSSMYTLVTKYLKPFLLREQKTLVIRGVAKVGAPIYTDYWPDFSSFSGEDFQNFWNILFINLLYREFIKDKDSFDPTRIAEFEQLCKASDVYLGAPEGDPGLVRSVIDRVKKFRVSGKGGPTGGGGAVEVSFATAHDEHHGSGLERPARVRTRAVIDFVDQYLEKYDKKVWIVLDQLDQAFERHSEIEKRALHALISEVITFNTDHLKLKIFLRDDIFDLISNYRGIVNVDHLRVSDALRWEEIDLLKLILKRLLHNEALLACFPEITNVEMIDGYGMDRCREIFYSLFPAKGGKGTDMWEYLLRELRDGNGLVTPRDLVVLLDKARSVQLKLITAGESESGLFSKKSLETALDQVSAYKVTNYINSEFPYLIESVSSLKYQWNKYDEMQLVELLGKSQFKQRVSQLFSVGVLYRKRESDLYWVAPLYQRGLEVRKRRAKKSEKSPEEVAD